MHWIYAVIGAGIYAWVSFCFAEGIDVNCSEPVLVGPSTSSTQGPELNASVPIPTGPSNSSTTGPELNASVPIPTGPSNSSTTGPKLNASVPIPTGPSNSSTTGPELNASVPIPTGPSNSSTTDVAMCKRGTASGPNITLQIEMTSQTYRCCCHLDFHTYGPVRRKMTVDCGIMVVHNVPLFFDKDCNERNDSFSTRIDQNQTDLCVFRKDTHTRNHLLQGQLMMMQALDIDVNCSEPVLVGPSTSSTQGPDLNVSVPVPTGPSNSSTKENKELLWIIISCVTGGVALITIAICGFCMCRRRRHKPQSIQGKADTGPVEDGDELVMVDNDLYSSGGFGNSTQHQTRVNGVEGTVNVCTTVPDRGDLYAKVNKTKPLS